MGIINGILPQASAATAHQTVAQSAPKADANVASTATQPAVIVSLSQDSKSRAVSSGSNKFVDSSFGSEKYKTSKKDKDSNEPRGKSSINVLA